jgi:hypothetical protein
VIGALQLRSDRAISEKGMIGLAKMGLETLRGGGRSGSGEDDPASADPGRETD